MNIIKLKDCFLTYISSQLSTEEERGYYGNDVVAVQEIQFYFSDNTKTGTFYVPESYGDFMTLVSFFHNVDFSETTKKEFVKNFCKHVCIDEKEIIFKELASYEKQKR